METFLIFQNLKSTPTQASNSKETQEQTSKLESRPEAKHPRAPTDMSSSTVIKVYTNEQGVPAFSYKLAS